MTEPTVAEQRRYCGRCAGPVGRSRNGSPGRTEGFCRHCGAPFSFTPKLRAGEVVADQYEVVGCLAHGGLGWIYLARDRNVADRWVVLKGLLNAGDEEALAAALAERLFLAEVEHPNIVKIINFVEREGSGYIVMEYVGGVSLKQLLASRRASNGGVADPLPASTAIAYVLEILPALGYLHRAGLLFCDLKLANVIQTQDSLKIIDLGGVHRIGDTRSPVYGTAGYQAPEIEHGGPSVASDLFTVARTLLALCIDVEGMAPTQRTSLPAPSETPLFARCDSLYRLLRRGTAPEPEDRFQSAEEMARTARRHRGSGGRIPRDAGRCPARRARGRAAPRTTGDGRGAAAPGACADRGARMGAGAGGARRDRAPRPARVARALASRRGGTCSRASAGRASELRGRLPRLPR